MSVEITFEPAGLTGLVAEGSNLCDAARRMGVMISTECGGHGECTSCMVVIEAGEQLLSRPTDPERNLLGEARLSQMQRLACQVRIEQPGELRLRVEPEKNTSGAADLRARFARLNLEQKVATLMQLEAVTMSEALNAITEKPLAFGQKVIEKLRAGVKTRGSAQVEKDLPPEKE